MKISPDRHRSKPNYPAFMAAMTGAAMALSSCDQRPQGTVGQVAPANEVEALQQQQVTLGAPIYPQQVKDDDSPSPAPKQKETDEQEPIEQPEQNIVGGEKLQTP